MNSVVRTVETRPQLEMESSFSKPKFVPYSASQPSSISFSATSSNTLNSTLNNLPQNGNEIKPPKPLPAALAPLVKKASYKSKRVFKVYFFLAFKELRIILLYLLAARIVRIKIF